VLEPMVGNARADDRCSLFYKLHPNPGAPRIALVHSLALDCGVWDAVIRELNDSAEVLAYDCRGHGQSERRAGKYTAELFGNDLAAVLDHAGWKSATIAGCSMGGVVAIAFAAAYPTRTDGLGLIDTTAWYGPAAEKDWRGRGEKAAQDGFAAMLVFQLSRWFSESFLASHPDTANALGRVFLANDVTCYQSTCAMMGSFDLREAIRSFRMPVSIVVGEEDYATPVAMSQALQDAIPGSTLRVIKSGRHLTPVQCPEEVAGSLRDLLQRRIKAQKA
jgi:3-oxoadipate enol-lactonase